MKKIKKYKLIHEKFEYIFNLENIDHTDLILKTEELVSIYEMTWELNLLKN